MTQLTIASRLEPRPRGASPVAVLAVSGDVTVERVPELTAAIDKLLGSGARHLVLDLQQLDFIDSASVGALLHLNQRQAKGSGRLVLCALRPAFRRLLDAAGLASAFPIAADVPAALAQLP